MSLYYQDLLLSSSAAALFRHLRLLQTVKVQLFGPSYFVRWLLPMYLALVDRSQGSANDRSVSRSLCRGRGRIQHDRWPTMHSSTMGRYFYSSSGWGDRWRQTYPTPKYLLFRGDWRMTGVDWGNDSIHSFSFFFSQQQKDIIPNGDHDGVADRDRLSPTQQQGETPENLS